MRGNELKVIRDLSRLPIARFAKTLGVGQTTIQRYEREESPIPHDFKRKLYKEFNITPEIAEEIRNAAIKLERLRMSMSN